MPEGYRTVIFRTRLGWAGIALTMDGVRAIVLPRVNRGSVVRDLQRRTDVISTRGGKDMPSPRIEQRAVDLLERFLEGKQRAMDLPVDLRGHTRFQRAVWKAAQEIPYGETRSYGWIAKRIGRPKAARAVGQAMGANPVPILVP